MKNKTSNNFFDNELKSQLESEEEVVWEGRPILSAEDKVIYAFECLVFILIVIYFLKKGFDLTLLLSSIIWVYVEIVHQTKRKKMRYLLTDQRILFQLYEKRKKKFHSLPLLQIEEIDVKKENKTNGAILIKTKDPKQLSFNTRNLKTGETRLLPSLEMIENVDEVAEHIKKGIQKNL